MALWSLEVGTGPPWPWRGTAPAPQPCCLPTPTVSQRRCSSPAHAASSSFPACFWGILTLQHPCRQRQQDGYPGGHVLCLSLLPARWRRVRRAGGSPSARRRLRASCWQGDPGITKPTLRAQRGGRGHLPPAPHCAAVPIPAVPHSSSGPTPCGSYTLCPQPCRTPLHPDPASPAPLPTTAPLVLTATPASASSPSPPHAALLPVCCHLPLPFDQY